MSLIHRGGVDYSIFSQIAVGHQRDIASLTKLPVLDNVPLEALHI
jgi:hypothetical protein